MYIIIITPRLDSLGVYIIDITSIDTKANTSDVNSSISSINSQISALNSDKEASHKITNINVSMKLTTSWQNTGINGTSIPDDGVYAIKLIPYTPGSDGLGINGLSGEIVAGIMAWYTGSTSSTDAFDIYTHESGLASNKHKIYLRTLRQVKPGSLQLQIKDSTAWSKTDTLHFYFVKLL